jgi:hypothetical protein
LHHWNLFLSSYDETMRDFPLLRMSKEQLTSVYLGELILRFVDRLGCTLESYGDDIVECEKLHEALRRLHDRITLVDQELRQGNDTRDSEEMQFLEIDHDDDLDSDECTTDIEFMRLIANDALVLGVGIVASRLVRGVQHYSQFRHDGEVQRYCVQPMSLQLCVGLCDDLAASIRVIVGGSLICSMCSRDSLAAHEACDDDDVGNDRRRRRQLRCSMCGVRRAAERAYRLKMEQGRSALRVDDALAAATTLLTSKMRRLTASARGWVVVLHATDYLAHLVRKRYALHNVAQRIYLLGMCGFRGFMRFKMLRHRLFARMFHGADALPSWLLGCSDTDEQYFLNTCSSGAANIALVHRAPSIVCLLVLAKWVRRHIARRLQFVSRGAVAYDSYWPRCFVPAAADVARRELDAVSAILEAIADDAARALDADAIDAGDALDADAIDAGDAIDAASMASMRRAHRLTLEWNYAMQRLSSVYAPSKPVVATLKPFQNRWHLSTRTLTPLCLLASLVVPGQPTLGARYRGCAPYYQEVDRILLFDYVVDKGDEQWRALPTALRDGAEKQSAAVELLSNLWRHCLHRGGVLFGTHDRIFGILVGHLSFMIAVRRDNERLFVISDPEVSAFKFMSFDAMHAMIADHGNGFDLMDT